MSLLLVGVSGKTTAAVGPALNYGSSGLTLGNVTLQGAFSPPTGVPFSDRAYRSPGSDYGNGNGTPFYGGAYIDSDPNAKIDQWVFYHNPSDPDGSLSDGPRFRVSATTPNGKAGRAIFLWNRDDFAPGYADTFIDLTDPACTLTYSGRSYGANISSQVSFVIQDSSGRYYTAPAPTPGKIPSNYGSISLTGLGSQTWTGYDPVNDVPVSGSPARNLAQVYAVGVRLQMTRLATGGGTTMTAMLSGFSVTAVTPSNTTDSTARALHVQALNDSRTKLTWTTDSSAHHYEIYRATALGAFPGTAWTSVKKTSTTYFFDYHLSPATNYYYIVASCDSTGTIISSSDPIVATTALAETNVPSGETAWARHPSVLFTPKEVAQAKALGIAVGSPPVETPWTTRYEFQLSLANQSSLKDPSTFDPYSNSETALAYGGTALVTADAGLQRVATGGKYVQFSNALVCSPDPTVTTYTGLPFYGGSFNTGSSAILPQVKNDSSGDYIWLGMNAPLSGDESAEVFLWHSADFAGGSIVMPSSGALAFTGHTTGTQVGTSEGVRFILVNSGSHYFISNSCGTMSNGTDSTLTLANPLAAVWHVYHPPSTSGAADSIETPNVTPDFTKIVSVGVRLPLIKSGSDGTAIGVALTHFTVNANEFITPSARGDAVAAMALAWQFGDAAQKDFFLPKIKAFLASMPTVESTMISSVNSDGTPVAGQPFYYISALNMTYPARGYALAYDIVYNSLTDAERATYAANLQKHAFLLHDTTRTDSIGGVVNNWVEAEAAGLAATGAALRDYIDPTDHVTQWGHLYLSDALTALQRTIPLGAQDQQIHGGGAFIEGEIYSAFAGYWGSEALNALRSVNFTSATNDLFKDPQYQAWLKYRTLNLTLDGYSPLIEDARLDLSDAKRWILSCMYEHDDPDVQMKLQWHYQRYLTEALLSTNVSSAVFRYLADAGVGTIPAASYIDSDGGLAFFRSGNPTTTDGDDGNSLVLVQANKKYGGKLVNPLDPSHNVSLEHVRPGAGSFELWAYGQYAINLPGYFTNPDTTNADYPQLAWARTDTQGQNLLKINGASQDKTKASEGFGTAFSTGHAIEFTNSTVATPYGGGGNSLMRTIAFVRPTTGTPGYFVVFDDVGVASSSSTLDSYFHGLAAGTNLTLASPQATWSGIQTPASSLSAISVIAHAVSPASFTLTSASKSFKEFYNGTVGTDADFLDLVPSVVPDGGLASGHAQTAMVFYPMKSTFTTPTIADDSPNDGGATISGVASGLADVVAIQAANTSRTVQGVTSDALALVARKNSTTGRLDCYFAHEAGGLTYSSGTIGFASNNLVDVTMNDLGGGKIAGTACLVLGSSELLTIYHPGITSGATVKLNGSTVSGTAATGSIQFPLPATGAYEIEITP